MDLEKLKQDILEVLIEAGKPLNAAEIRSKLAAKYAGLKKSDVNPVLYAGAKVGVFKIMNAPANPPLWGASSK